MIYIIFLFIFIFTFDTREKSNSSITRNIIIYLTLTLITAEILSLFQIFNVLTIRISTSIFLFGYVGLYLLKYQIDFFNRLHFSVKNTFSQPVVIVFGLLTASALIYLPSNTDSNTYHLPRFIHWLQNGNLNHYTTCISRQVYQPYLNEIFLSFIYSTFGPYSLLNLWQVIFLYFCYLVLLDINNLIPNKFKITHKNIFTPFLLCWSLLLQSVTTKNDVILLFFILYLIYLIIDFRKNPQVGLVILCSILGYLTKGTFNVYIIAITILFLGCSIIFKIIQEYGKQIFSRDQLKQFLIFGSIGCLLLTPTIYRNISLTENIFGQSESELSAFQNSYKSLSVGVSNSIKNLVCQSFTPFGNPLTTEEIESAHRYVGLPNVNDSNLNWMGGRFKVPTSTIKCFFNADTVPNLLILYFSVGILVMIFIKCIIKNANKQDQVFLFLTGLSLFVLFIFSLILRWQIWHTRLLLPVFLLQSVAIVNYLEKTIFSLFLKPVIIIISYIIIIFNAQQPLLAHHNITKEFPNFWNTQFWNVALENKIPEYVKNVYQYSTIRDKIGSKKIVGIICGWDHSVFGYVLANRKTRNEFYYYPFKVKNATEKLSFKNPKIEELDYIILNTTAIEESDFLERLNSFQIIIDTSKTSNWILLRNKNTN